MDLSQLPPQNLGEGVRHELLRGPRAVGDLRPPVLVVPEELARGLHAAPLELDVCPWHMVWGRV